MSSTIDYSSLTLTSEEARVTSELVFDQVYTAPEVESVHGIMTDVDMDKYIPILGQYGLMGKADPGSCGVNDESGQIPTSQKQWTPKLISGRITHCQDDLPNLLKFWKKSRIANNTWEEVDNEMMAFIMDRAADAVKQSVLRLSSFGDTAADVVGSGGNLTAGTTNTYFTPFDGMWKQIYTDQAGSALIYRYTISENGEASKAAQLALADDAALNVFRTLYNNIDSRAFESGNLVFEITKSLFDNWQDFMEDKSLVISLDRTEQGSTRWSYRGIPIVIRYDWDRMIRTYHDLGTTFHLPHRAVLTDLNNIPIGTSDTESLTSFESFYWKKDKKHYIDFAYKLDMKILQEYALAVAY